ncbi:hypothetical protein ACQE3E_07930 [Methylomonas sp. MED-D]|uniref:hypothetical protein n=1 Tax=unclassified Methylomonas TaxID=2608980 RepID=UPI0028A3B5C1|nr:hypothetical protein [Methylomonas sp. MV1]MDT4329158.1 hypothetical protein [Methylomonas sp. MV1]
MATTQTQLGWLRDVSVARDSCEPRAEAVTRPRASRRLTTTAKQKRRPFDPGLRPAPGWDHGDQDCHTDNAIVGAIKHLERLAFGKYLDASRLFLYKATRTLANEKVVGGHAVVAIGYDDTKKIGKTRARYQLETPGVILRAKKVTTGCHINI